MSFPNPHHLKNKIHRSASLYIYIYIERELSLYICISGLVANTKKRQPYIHSSKNKPNQILPHFWFYLLNPRSTPHSNSSKKPKMYTTQNYSYILPYSFFSFQLWKTQTTLSFPFHPFCLLFWEEEAHFAFSSSHCYHINFSNKTINYLPIFYFF